MQSSRRSLPRSLRTAESPIPSHIRAQLAELKLDPSKLQRPRRRGKAIGIGDPVSMLLATVFLSLVVLGIIKALDWL